jgi:hypothetical protein
MIEDTEEPNSENPHYQLPERSSNLADYSRASTERNFKRLAAMKLLLEQFTRRGMLDLAERLRRDIAAVKRESHRFP